MIGSLMITGLLTYFTSNFCSFFLALSLGASLTSTSGSSYKAASGYYTAACSGSTTGSAIISCCTTAFWVGSSIGFAFFLL